MSPAMVMAAAITGEVSDVNDIVPQPEPVA
jgi:homoaconitase/3-isopropylmalate dehydratase large subunit